MTKKITKKITTPELPGVAREPAPCEAVLSSCRVALTAHYLKLGVAKDEVAERVVRQLHHLFPILAGCDLSVRKSKSQKPKRRAA